MSPEGFTKEAALAVNPEDIAEVFWVQKKGSKSQEKYAHGQRVVKGPGLRRTRSEEFGGRTGGLRFILGYLGQGLE